MALDLSTFTLTFNDDFNSFNTSPDGDGAWKTQFYFGGHSLPSNGEQEYYADPSSGVNPFHLDDGSLVIHAQPGDNPDGLPYTSGMISTEGTFSQTYGYFEIGATLPEGQGMWPAFWLLNADHSWPPELDVLEAFGGKNANGEGGTDTYHVGSITSNWDSGGGGSWVGSNGDISAGQHVYGVDWEPDTTTFYQDGQQVYQVATPSDMHSPMYMLANLAVGGNWPGAPAGESGDMKIDFIRAWSHDAPPDTVPINGEGQPSQPDWVTHNDAPPAADVAAAPQADVPPPDAPQPDVAFDASQHTDWLQA